MKRTPSTSTGAGAGQSESSTDASAKKRKRERSVVKRVYNEDRGPREKDFEVNGVGWKCALEESEDWRKNHGPIPWSFFQRYLATASLTPTSQSRFAAVWTCSLEDCKSDPMVQWDTDEKDIRSQLSKHLDNRHKLDQYQGRSKGAEDGGFSTSSRVVQQREFCKAILNSQLPYSVFIKTGSMLRMFLAKRDIPLLNGRAFRAVAKELAWTALERIKAELRGEYIMISIDASPAKNKKNFISRVASIVTESCDFKMLSLGVVYAPGIAKADDYVKHINDCLNAFEVSTFAWDRSDGKWSDPLLPKLDEGVVLCGATDMGAGALQACDRLTDSSVNARCCAHGLNLIGAAAVKATESVLQVFEACKDLSKQSRSTDAIRRDFEEKKVPLGPKFRKIRWGVWYRVATWASSHWEQIKTIAAIKSETRTVIEGNISALKEMPKLWGLINAALAECQLEAPMDAIVMPFEIAGLLWEVRTRSYPSLFLDSKRLIEARLSRRFFSGAFEALPQGTDGDQTRKWNMFTNEVVLAAWCLSPICDFGILRTFELCSEAEQKRLVASSERALKDLHKLVSSDDWQVGSTRTVPTDGVAVPAQRFACLSTPKAEQPPDVLHDKQRDAFRSHPDILEAWKQYRNTMDTIPPPGGKIDRKGARFALFKGFISVAKAGPRWIFKVMRVLCAWQATSVKNETDFSAFQHLLTERRLRMSPDMIVAYFLAKKMPEYLVTDTACALVGNKPVARILQQFWQNNGYSKTKRGEAVTASDSRASTSTNDGTVEAPVVIDGDEEEEATGGEPSTARVSQAASVPTVAPLRRSSRAVERSDLVSAFIAKETKYFKEVADENESRRLQRLMQAEVIEEEDGSDEDESDDDDDDEDELC